MMIGCQMNSLDGDPSQHNLQNSSFAHNSCTPTTPISPVFGGTMCAQQQLSMQPPQLSRSKSLNDISNDSQISAFASDRSINFNPNQNNNNANSYQATDPNANCNLVVDQNNYNPFDSQHHSLAYNHPHLPHQNSQQHFTATAHLMPMESPYNIYANSSQQQITRNLNDNQCSNSSSINKQLDSTTPVSPNTLFDMCNPMAINLNGVTEQIGNLHL